MYEHYTPEYIKADILGGLKLADTREGSYNNTLVSGVAHVMWKVLQSLDAVVPMVFVDDTSGRYIDLSADSYGIKRKPGARARAEAVFHGVDGTVVKKGKIFMTADSLRYSLDSDSIISGGAAEGRLTALEPGAAYNAPAGAIFRQSVNQAGIESVECSAAEGGSDAETDAALVGRYDEYRRRPPTSGNVAHYMQWALESDGVGAAKVEPLWAGPGTVLVLVAGPKKQPVDGATVAGCAAHIESQRPIGADITVKSADGLAIDVSALVSLRPSTDAAAVGEAFAVALADYLEGIAFTGGPVVYNRIGYILLGLPGVVDFRALAVNSGSADVEVGVGEVPIMGQIEVAT